MIYARAHDQTVADDYFKAMEQVEQRLELPLKNSNRVPSLSEMLSLAELLFIDILHPDQLEILLSLREGLSQLVDRQTK